MKDFITAVLSWHVFITFGYGVDRYMRQVYDLGIPDLDNPEVRMSLAVIIGFITIGAIIANERTKS